MQLRLTANLIFGLLLTGLLACSRKEEQTPTPAPTASYVLDGRSITATVTQQVVPISGRDFLALSLITTPQPSSGQEVLYLSFWKQTGQPASAYELTPSGGLSVVQNGTTLDFQTRSATLTLTSAGVASGSFAGQAATLTTGTPYPVTHTITGGTFANVQP